MTETTSNWSWAWPWWTVLVIIAAVNVIIMIWSNLRARRIDEPGTAVYRKAMLIMGTIYVSVGAYRTVFVSSYLEQLAWFDLFLNSSLLIRFFAFFAEVSFALLIFLTVKQITKEVPWKPGKGPAAAMLIEKWVPWFFVGCLFIAQFFATTATITKFVTLFAIEESLWGIGFLAISPVIFIQLYRVFSHKDAESAKAFLMFRVFTVMLAIFCVGYGSYSVFYHLPLEYWPYAVNQFANGPIPEPVIRSGWPAVRDALLVVNETKDYARWGGIGFVIWHTGYFTTCVWMVLFMMNAPRRRTVKA